MTFSSQFKSKVGNILGQAAALPITLHIDGTPVASKSHTHPSHSQISLSINLVFIFRCSRLEIPIDSGMGFSIAMDTLRVFINKTLSTQSLINQLLIKRVGLSISIDSR